MSARRCGDCGGMMGFCLCAVRRREREEAAAPAGVLSSRPEGGGGGSAARPRPVSVDVPPVADGKPDLAPVDTPRPGQPCDWFALCPNEATRYERHPILGRVPICERCHEHTTAADA